MKLLISTLLLLTVSVAAQELPDAPHKFMDRQNVILFSSVAAVRALDVHSTHYMLERGNRETILPNAIATNDAAMSAYSALAVASHIYACRWLHKTGHHRMERVMSYVHVAGIGYLVVKNYSLPRSR